MNETKLTFSAENAQEKHGWLPWYAYNYSKDISERMQNKELSQKDVHEFNDKASKILRKVHTAQTVVLDEENKKWRKYEASLEVEKRIEEIKAKGEGFDSFEIEEEFEKVEMEKEKNEAFSLINSLIKKDKK